MQFNFQPMQMQQSLAQQQQMQHPYQAMSQFQAGTRQVMPEPPNVMSTKDTLYTRDAMSWSLTAAKKYNLFAMMCSDPEIRNYFERIGQIHQKHYNILLSHMNPNSSYMR